MFNTEGGGGGGGGGEERDVAVGTDCTLRPVALVVTQQSPTATAAATPTPTASSDGAEAPVRRVVCSPDLPVFPTFDESAADSSTGPDRVFKCSFCQKTFSQKNTYQNHLRSHGKEGEDRYQCNYCGKTFAVPARLTRHYRTHTGEKPYQCEYCKKSFSVKENLSVHRRIHTKERPYKCDICERAFEHSGKLHRHMRIHTGERPHKCAICQKTFIQSGQLVIHMRTHTGEKPYVCKSCGKGFTCSKQLKVHSRTHTGEKPYSCEICGKAFGYNHVLKLHQVAHFGEKVYKCTICNQTFTSKKTMEGHIKSHSEPAAPHSNRPEERSPEASVGESSCASSTSDKENKMDSTERIRTNIPSANSYSNSYIIQNNNNSAVNNLVDNGKNDRSEAAAPQPHPNIKELCQYLYPRSPQHSTQQQQQQHSMSSGLNPTLLAAVAAAAANEERQEPTSHRDIVLMSPVPSSSNSLHTIETSSSLPVTEPPVYLNPDPMASIQRRPAYQYQLHPLPECLQNRPVLINLPLRTSSSDGSDGDPLLTPPSSNPVSPVPSSSPELVAIPELDAIPTAAQVQVVLPLRKRSKMILKSMESEVAAVRYSSVIHYAKAS